MIAKISNWARKNPTIGIFLYCYVFSLLISPGTLCQDTEPRLQVTHWLWGNGPQVSPEETNYTRRLKGRNGQIFAQFSIGQSIAMLPADLLAHGIIKLVPKLPQRQVNELFVTYATFPAINALCLAFVFLICHEMGLAIRSAALCTLIFQWSTSFLVYCHYNQENNLILLSLLAGLYYTKLWLNGQSSKCLLYAALFLGFSLLIRITAITAFLAWPFFVGLSWNAVSRHSQFGHVELRKQIQQIFLVFVPVALFFLAIERGYQFYRFENWTGTLADEIVKAQRAVEPQYPTLMEFKAWKGFGLQLFHPRKSLFLFEIALWLSIPLLVYRQKGKSFAGLQPLFAFGLISLVSIGWIYGGTGFWHGDSAWGPRHISTFAQLVCLPLIIEWVRRNYENAPPDAYRTTSLRLGWVILGLACLVQIEGVLLFYGLEVAQYKANSPLVVPHVQRLVNLAAFATGNFDKWGLSYGREEAEVLAKLNIQFMPFLTKGFLPSIVSRILIVLWCILVAVFVWFSAVLLRKLTRPTP